jgi:DNA-binding MarR family transcriptional regulator
METLPFEIGETAHALRRAFDRRAAALGVTRAQWKVMFRLARQPGLRQVELADQLDVEPITLCRIVDRLEEANLVERRRDPSDRRAWQLFLTATAEPINRKLRSLGDILIDEAFDGINPADIAIARQVLGRVRDNLSNIPAETKASNQ